MVPSPISLVTKLLGQLAASTCFDPRFVPAQRLRRNQRRRVLRHARRAALLRLARRQDANKVYGVTLMLMVCLASGLLFGSTPKGAMATLCFCFFLGLGIGGDYLLSATIMFMSEYANKWSSGRVAPSSRPISPYRASATSPVASSPFMFSTVSRCYSPRRLLALARDGQTVRPIR
jgi:hypothetical protein